MASKRKSEVRLAYEKEYKRIDRMLLRIRREGYDITKLNLPPKNPNRVTQKRLEELKEITPRKIRHILKNERVAIVPPKGTPLRSKETGEFLTQREVFEDYRKKELRRKEKEARASVEDVSHETYEEPQEEYETEPTEEQPETYEEYPPEYDTYSEVIDESDRKADEFYEEWKDWKETQSADEPPEEPQIPATEEPPEEPREIYPQIDEERGVVQYVDLETGEILEESPLGVTISEDTITYYDAMTGEIINEIPNLQGLPDYDATAYAIDYLRSLFDKFSYQTKDIFNQMLDKMIEMAGTQEVANAFLTKSEKSGRTLIEDIEDSGHDYEEISHIFGRAIENMPFSEEDKDAIRNELYQMSGFFEG